MELFHIFNEALSAIHRLVLQLKSTGLILLLLLSKLYDINVTHQIYHLAVQNISFYNTMKTNLILV